MAWLLLILAGIFEVGFTTSLKLSNNFTNLKWSIIFFICIGLSFLLLNNAIKSIPMGTAYAVWTGIGAAGTLIIGILFFHEPTSWPRILFLMLLIGSIVGLKAVA
ncbi:DMT family transporter [Echinicola shivajiensis]|uniref:DMT family transporter n=1 Tax=Echinicola shivajiensis TaxID=1035916 RepID=UPI001BFC2B73|nr:multidrug efflux SMR transporter [Echinicola shivajiensis]